MSLAQKMSASDFMTEEHRRQLLGNLDTIVKLLRSPDTVTDKLVGAGVLTKEEHEDLAAIRPRNKQARELVMLLPKTSEKGFEVFMEALLETNQHPLASCICPKFPVLKGLCPDFSQPQQETTAENDTWEKFVVPSGETDAQELKYAFFNTVHRMEDCLESYSETEKEKLRSETAYFLKLLDQYLEIDEKELHEETRGFLKLSGGFAQHHANTSPYDTHANTSPCDTVFPKLVDSDDVEMDETSCDSPGEGQMTIFLEQETRVFGPTVLFDIEESLSDTPSGFGTECSNVVTFPTQLVQEQLYNPHRPMQFPNMASEVSLHPEHLPQAHQQGFVCQPSGTDVSLHPEDPPDWGQAHQPHQPYDAYQNSMSHSYQAQPNQPESSQTQYHQQQLCTGQSHDVSLSERLYHNPQGNPTSTMTYNHQGPCLHGYSPTN